MKSLVENVLLRTGFVAYRHHAWTEDELSKGEADLQKCRQKEDSLSAQLQGESFLSPYLARRGTAMLTSSPLCKPSHVVNS